MRLSLFSYVLPSTVALVFQTHQYNAQFDGFDYDYTSTNPIGFYNNLTWNHFYLYRPYDEGSGGRTPTSALAGLDNGFPTLRSDWPGSPISFFDLSSFNWACIRNDPVTGLFPETAANCRLSIRGWVPSATKSLPRIVKTLYYFAADSDVILGQHVNLSLFFRACDKIDFELEAMDGGDAVLLLDNVKYKVYSITSWDRWGVWKVEHEDGPYGIA